MITVEVSANQGLKNNQCVDKLILFMFYFFLDELNQSVLKRRLQNVQLSASEYPPKADCFATNTEIKGDPLYTLEGIVSAAACQKNCVILQECKFFSYHEDKKDCYIHKQALGVTGQRKVTSGPRSCTKQRKCDTE